MPSISPPYTICFLPKTKEEQEQETLIYKTYDEFVSTLPKSNQTHVQLSNFNGFWFPDGASYGLKVLQGTLAAQDHFISRPDDILLATLPKAGTTWLKALAFATLNRENTPHPQSLLLDFNPHQCVPFLEYQLFSDNRIPDLEKLPSPRLLATHIPYSLLPESVTKNENGRIIYLCRNPRDMLISMWKFANNLIKDCEPASLEEFLKVFLAGVYASGPFWDNVLEYWNASVKTPNKVLFLKFEDLKKEPKVQLKKLAEFMGFPFSEGEEKEGVIERILELCSLENLKRLEVKQTSKTLFWGANFDNKSFFRKGEVGDWINYMSPEMVEDFERVMKEKFEGTDLSFE